MACALTQCFADSETVRYSSTSTNSLLSGINDDVQLNENLELAYNSLPGMLTKDENKIPLSLIIISAVSRVRKIRYDEL